jgi:hypothetical protein
VGIVKTKRRQKVVLRATKNPLRPRNKLSHAPDAVSREYRGKTAIRKEYFACAFVIPSEVVELSCSSRKMLSFSSKIDNKAEAPHEVCLEEFTNWSQVNQSKAQRDD